MRYSTLKSNRDALHEEIPFTGDSALNRGTEQIRTAVKGFADLCLATRPRYQIQNELVERLST